jgi:adenylate cyclase
MVENEASAKAKGKPPIWKRLFDGWRIGSIGLLLLLAYVQFKEPLPLEILRVKTFDLYQNLKPRPIPQDKVVIIADLDEASLATIGQWPWPRTIVAQLIDQLTAMGAVTIGFDIVFAEPDRMSPSSLANSLGEADKSVAERLKALPSNDAVLAAALGRSRVILGETVLTEVNPHRTDAQDLTGAIAELGGNPRPYLDNFPELLRNLPELEATAAGRGVFTVFPETDGVVRRVPAVLAAKGQLRGALSLEMLKAATGNNSLAVKSTPGVGIDGVIVRPNLVRTDANGRIWPYYSHSDKDKYISIKSILDGTVDPAKIAGRLVLIGTSAAGLLDIKTLPVERNVPGVEVHAQIIENILMASQLSRPIDAPGLELVATLAIGLLMIILVPLIGARWTLALLVAIAVGVIGFSWFRFSNQRELYDPSFTVIVASFLYILLTYAAHASEEKQRRQVREAFSRYLSPAMVEKVAADPSALKLGGEMRDMTIMFSDIRGFTTISEQFDAEGLTRFINRFLTPMTDLILGRQGTIDKYMGDCIMAFWNAPLDDAEHARHACDSALAMKIRLADLNKALEEEAKAENRKFIPINVGIGLNSGVCCVGNMGSDQFFGYSVLGDNVNLASRLEGQSKTYGVTCVIGENTLEKARDYATLELDLIKVKGKTEAVRIFTLLGLPEMRQTPEFQALEAKHNEMLAAYRAQKLDECEALILECRKLGEYLHLDGLYDLYVHRIEDNREHPPGPDWDGVYVAKTK